MDRSGRVSSLLDARLAVPHARVGAIPRGRVAALLDDAIRHHPVTLVTGGAGTGKTMAVADWAEDSPWPVAWVSVDRGLRSQGRAWSSIVLALRSTVPGALERLRVPEVVDEEFVEVLANSLEGQDVCLVLDDVHELGDAFDNLDHLLRLRPGGLRLVLVARHDPPLTLHRLRVAGQLGEVRASELAFTDEEARALLTERAITVPEGEFRTLMALTEGWAAGLRFAAMTLEAASDPVEAVRQFSGRQSLVAGYLMEEVVRRLGRDRGEFLLRTSITDRVCGPLARVLTGERASAQVLQEIARENALVTELGSGWFRCHPLLRQMLQANLRVENPDLERDLHRRAAGWHEARAEWLTALEYALDSEDWDFVGQLAMRSVVVQVFSGDRTAFADLVLRVPHDVARTNPELRVAVAFAAFSRADPDVGQALRATEQIASLPEPRRSLAMLNVRILVALAARGAGDGPALASAATEAIELLDHIGADDAHGWAIHRWTPRAIAAIGELWCGHPRRALTLFRESLTNSRPSDLRGYGGVYHRGYVALAELAAGRIAVGRDLARAALEEAQPMGASIRHESAAAWLALAAAEVYRGDVQAAERALTFGKLAAERGRDPFVAAGLQVVAARRALLLGDLAGARRRLTHVDAALGTSPGMILIARLSTALRVDVELAAGAPERARQVLSDRERVSRVEHTHDTSAEPDFLAVPRARVLLATGHPERVRDAVAGVLGQEGIGGAEAWLVVALVEDRLRHDAAATEALARALDRGAREDAAYPFLRPGDRLAAMLLRHEDVVGTHREFVDEALATAANPWLPRSSTDVAPQTLTDREISVLAHLPTMSSNLEIADALGISVNTVKQHLKAINRKLGVTSRRDAVRVARRFGILPVLPASG